jgi:hypothetical protein
MTMHLDRSDTRARAYAASLIAAMLLAPTACGKQDAPRVDSATTLAPAPADAPAAASASATSGAASTPVRGIVAAVSDTAITVTTSTGAQQIRVVAPLRVYARTASDLAHVTPNAFVGVTSVAQNDGSERATQVNIFPEELRGIGEGTRMMEQTGGNGSSSRMTNGSVAPARMTNGTVAGSRMTNGAIARTAGDTIYTVQFKGGTQTIRIPAGVNVTAVVPTTTRLSPGASVVVLTSKGADGRLSTSGVLIASPPKK